LRFVSSFHREVFLALSLDDHSCLGRAHETMLVQTLVAELAVEALDVGVLHGLAGTDEAQANAAAIGPLVEHAASELGSVVDVDGDGCTAARDHMVELARSAQARDRVSGTLAGTVTRNIMDGETLSWNLSGYSARYVRLVTRAAYYEMEVFGNTRCARGRCNAPFFVIGAVGLAYNSRSEHDGNTVTFKWTAAFISALALSAPCFGQLSISPQAPTVLDTIRIQLPAAAIPRLYNPSGTHVSMASNKITVALGTIDFEPLPNTRPLDWPVGPLPAGTYQVEVRLDQAVLGASQVTVLPRPSQVSPGCARPCGPLWSHTDMWWNSAESGWGASIVQHGSGAIFGVFFVYAADGTAMWYVLPGGRWTSTTEFDGALYQTRGPLLEAFDPRNVTISTVGSAVLAFSDTTPDQASVTLTIGGRTIQKAIQRMTY
jgi:hypothetical protein